MFKLGEGMNTGFFINLLILIAIGLIMLFSASSPVGLHEFGDSYHFVKKQIIWIIIGVFIMLVVSRIDYHHYSKLSLLGLAAGLIFVGSVYVIGEEIAGVRRWVSLGGVGFQPSEFLKIVLIIFLADKLSRRDEKLRKFFRGFMPYMFLFGIIATLLVFQPHYSATVLILFIGMIMLIVGGAKLSHVAMVSSLGLVVLGFLMYKTQYSFDRIMVFLDPFSNSTNEGYQITQSLNAIGSGGLFGLGLGQSRQKFLWLPESQNDFIFSIVSEELGFIGAAIIMTLFITLIWRGIKIGINSPDAFGLLLSFGFMLLIALQLIINIGVATASIPVTGMQLPFFSSGGSSLIFLMAAMGIVLNVSRQSASR